MKRRLAFLLALSLTFASFPVAGAGATETAAATDTEVVTVVEQEENSGEGVSVEEETVDSTNEVKEETAGTSESEKSQETTQTEEETANKEVVSDENTTNENTDVVEDATAGITEDAAAGMTETEVAAVVEPEQVTVVVKPEEVVAAEEVKQAPAATVQPHWVSNGGNWYYVTSTGAYATGFYDIQGVRYYFFGNGKMATGWINPSGWYYFDESGAMKKGWLKQGGSWYYLDPSTGRMATGFKTIGGETYYFKGNGAMATGWLDPCGWYYFDESGAMHKGWLQEGGKRYYLDPSNGKLVTSFKTIGGKTYYFKGNGAMATGWLNPKGWYYFDANGVMKKGWLKDGGKWYYMDTTTGKMLTGWIVYHGVYYYLNPSGDMATGWKKLYGTTWFYFNGNGDMRTGWLYYGKEWYYLSKNPNKLGAMVTNWQKIDNVRYFFDPSSGVMASAPRYCVDPYGNRKNDYYFFYENGSLGEGEGPKKNGGIEYYTNAAGILYRNKTIKGKYYDEYGRYGDPMDTKAQGYSSSTNYLILCDKTKFKVRVYKGSKGSWTRIKDWDCTHGGSDTPNGVFTIDDHVTKRDATWGWADFDFSSAAFSCHISAGNYFHSILFDKGTRGNPYNQSYRILDDQLRTTYSHGCIRLKLENAEWVWDNIPFGTKVVVYNS